MHWNNKSAVHSLDLTGCGQPLMQELLLLGYTWLSRRVLVPLVARVVPRAVLGRRRRGHSEATEPSSSASSLLHNIRPSPLLCYNSINKIKMKINKPKVLQSSTQGACGSTVQKARD